jgi:hypothetical protein
MTDAIAPPFAFTFHVEPEIFHNAGLCGGLVGLDKTVNSVRPAFSEPLGRRNRAKAHYLGIHTRKRKLF